MPRAHKPTELVEKPRPDAVRADDTHFVDEEDAPQPAPARRDTRPPVPVRVLKRGDGKIFTGNHDPITQEAEVYERGEITAPIPRASADAYEDMGYGEIVEPTAEPAE